MTIEEILELVRPNIRTLKPYSTARDEFKGELGVFLDANESPYDTGWNRYPDPHQNKLKELVSKQKGIDSQCLFLGNGSDEAIDVLYRVFCVPSKDNVVAISPSYGMYTVTADINDIEVRTVLLNPDFSLPVDRLLTASDHRTKMMFLCSPNNPSGNTFDRDAILSLLKGFHGMVVLDEAYVDFCSGGSLKDLIPEYPNLVILQTCSKARGLAALRLGMAIADRNVIRLMSMVKYPYNISGVTQKIALEFLSRSVESEVAEIIRERGRLIRELAQFKFVRKVYPSEANFILIKVDDADGLYDYLTSREIIVRNRSKVPMCEGCLRITVGLEEENNQLLKHLKSYETCDIC